jgi:hypothetical protein
VLTLDVTRHSLFEHVEKRPPTAGREVRKMGPVTSAGILFLHELSLALSTLRMSVHLEKRCFINVLGVLALAFSAVSPSDDFVQQEMIRPPAQCSRMSAFAKLAPKRPTTFLWTGRHDTAGRPGLLQGAGRFSIRHQRPRVASHVASSTLIHSPPRSS